MTGKELLSAALPANRVSSNEEHISNSVPTELLLYSLIKIKTRIQLTGHFRDNVLESSMISSSLIFFSTIMKHMSGLFSSMAIKQHIDQ